MSRGYVYILTNEAMPGLVKIGKTTRCVDGRASELYQTGVPLPFTVYSYAESPDCHTLEVTMHELLAEHRVSQSREFFKFNASDADHLLEIKHKEMIQQWVQDFLPDHSVVSGEYALDEGDISHAAHVLGVQTMDVCAAIQMAWPEDLVPAMERWKARVDRVRAEQAESAKVIRIG